MKDLVLFGLRKDEEIILRDEWAGWMPSTLANYACTFYLTNQRIVVEKDANSMGAIFQTIYPMGAKGIIMEMSLEEIVEFKAARHGLSKAIYIEGVNGNKGKVLTNKQEQFLELLEDK